MLRLTVMGVFVLTEKSAERIAWRTNYLSDQFLQGWRWTICVFADTASILNICGYLRLETTNRGITGVMRGPHAVKDTQ